MRFLILQQKQLSVAQRNSHIVQTPFLRGITYAHGILVRETVVLVLVTSFSSAKMYARGSVVRLTSCHRLYRVKLVVRMIIAGSGQENLQNDTDVEVVSSNNRDPPVLSHDSETSLELDIDNFYSQLELRDMDSNLAFVIPSTSYMKTIKEQAIRLMETASEPMTACGICELKYCSSDVTPKLLTDNYIELMRQCLTLHPDASLPDEIKAQYNASDIDPRLEGLLLYRPAITEAEATTQMQVCDTCGEHVGCGKYTVPPEFAIANGNYIGHLPRRFKAMTRTDEQAVALVLPCVSLSVVTGGSCKTIKSHHYVVRNTEGSIVNMLPRDLSSRVRVAMVGCMTPEQAATCKKRYQLNVGLCNQFLSFLKQYNAGYHCQSEMSNPSPQAIPTTVIIDRSNEAHQSPDDDQEVFKVRDESTYSAFGSTVNEGVDATVEGAWIGASSLLYQPHSRNWTDILVRKSNSYVPISKWAVCTQMFPTLFPFGCGGPSEPRQKNISTRKWILRCLQLDDHRFETHYAFLLLAFDFLATQEARRTMYVKMNIKRHALKAVEIRRSTVREAIQYVNYMAACRQKGIKPRPPSNNIQRVIDLRKGLYFPESTFYGSNAGRMRARHDLFGMLKRFGPLQVFFTVSPDSAGSYNIAIKVGQIEKRTLEEANLSLVPNRAERKAIAAAHPVECARYFLRVMETVVEVLLGWDTKAGAPKRGGGIFGVVRAFGAAAETQIAGDLHAHFSVWLFGFPSTSEEYRTALQTNADFRERVIQLADCVLCTKPPAILGDRQCPVCFADNSLEPLTPGVDAFRRPTTGSSPPITSRCTVCGVNFGDKDIINRSINNLTDQQQVHVDSQLVDFEKCSPPSMTGASDLATSLLVRDVQVHYWNHSRSCFKMTARTPKASVCRFFKPEEVKLGPTSIEDGPKLKLHRAVGCEYVNAYNPVVMEVLKCNHDAQFVFGGSKDTAAYVAKYCFKNQNPVENHTALSLAAFAKATNKANELPPDTTPIQRGYRILGSMLYSVTNGQEIAATMAALYVLRETPFWFSHEFVHVNLKNVLRRTMESVEVTLSQQQMQREQGAISADNALERYWKRKTSLENISFMDICENYEYSGKQRCRSNNRSSVDQVVLFSKMRTPKVFVLCGEQIPDITSSLDNDQREFYYTALLTLFKPHRKCTLLTDNLSLLSNYKDFLESGDPELVRMLKMYESKWQDFHHSMKNSDVEGESLEEQLLRTRAPPSSSWVPSGNQACTTRDDSDIGSTSDPIPDDFVDITDIVTPNASTTKLCEDATKTVGTAKNVDAAISTASMMYNTTPSVLLPTGFTSDSYTTRVIKSFDDGAVFGTEEFIQAFPTARTRIERLKECWGPVPFPSSRAERQWTPATLSSFPKISIVSQAYELNFWQHVIFEICARHLLYSYSKDIGDASGDDSFCAQFQSHPYGIKDQFIGYLGGEAGTGKSTVVDALLTLAKLWGRDGSVETLAFTGAAAINIHGKTMHSARNLQLHGAEPRTAPSMEMKARFGQVVLVIIDEISISHQTLLGGTDSVSRSMSKTPQKFMGGKHVLFIGDLLQLPPVGGHPCYKTPPGTANRLRHAGYAIYSAINFVVFLMENMRARLDPVYAGILDNVRWGRISDSQLDKLNSRVNNHLEIPQARNSITFYRPIVVCTNRLRCAINHFMVFKIAVMHGATVFECLAKPSARSKAIVENLANATDDMTDRVPLKLLFYIGMPAMITRKHPSLVDADVIANGVIGTIVGMFPPANNEGSTKYSVNGVIIHRLEKLPELLLIKIHGCSTTLISGFPEGVIGLPPLHTALQLKRFPNLAQTSVTVDQFAVVPAFACTTEKLQGQTCHDGVVVTPLDRRKGIPKQTFYVALSRVTSLSGLTLTDKVTRQYLENFRPNEETVTEMRRLIGMICLPMYASSSVVAQFRNWKARQHP